MGVLYLHQTEHKEEASAEGGAPCQGAAHGAGSCQVGRIKSDRVSCTGKFWPYFWLAFLADWLLCELPAVDSWTVVA